MLRQLQEVFLTSLIIMKSRLLPFSAKKKLTCDDKQAVTSSLRENYSKFAKNKANIFLRVQTVIRVFYEYFTSLILHELKYFFNFFPIY